MSHVKMRPLFLNEAGPLRSPFALREFYLDLFLPKLAADWAVFFCTAFDEYGLISHSQKNTTQSPPLWPSVFLDRFTQSRYCRSARAFCEPTFTTVRTFGA
jgi:hypothetical protein